MKKKISRDTKKNIVDDEYFLGYNLLLWSSGHNVLLQRISKYNIIFPNDVFGL